MEGCWLLDACTKALWDEGTEEECHNDIFEGLVLKLGKTEEDATHELHGPFATWLQLKKSQEWLKDREPQKDEEKDALSPQSVDAAEIEKNVQGKHKLASDGGQWCSQSKEARSHWQQGIHIVEFLPLLLKQIQFQRSKNNSKRCLKIVSFIIL